MRALAAVVVVAGLLAGPGAASALASFSFDVQPPTATEGTAFTVTVTRTGTLPLNSASVNVVVGKPGDTASSGSDYTPPANNTLTWGIGESGSKTLIVNTAQDTAYEGNETVTFELANPVNETISGLSSITRHIGDDDTAPTISIGDASVAEGTGGNPTVMSFPVTLSAASGRATTAQYSTADGTAVAGQDYTAKTNQTLTIPAGQTQGAITVDVTPDDVVEPNENFTVTLGTLDGATLSGTGVGTGTINNDDSPPTLRILGPAPTPEGSTGLTTPFEFVIELSRPTTTSVTVGYATNDGSATAPADYAPTEASVTFAPGETRKVVTIPVVADKALEPNENFSVALSVETAGGIVATVGEATAIIVDDDAPVPAPPATGVLGNQPAADTTPPRVKLSKITSSRGVMRVTVTCPVGESVCRGTMTVFNIPKRSSRVKALRGEVKLATSLFVIKGGEQARLTLRPSRRAASLIRKARTIRARGYAVARDAAGNVATVRTTGTVRAAR